MDLRQSFRELDKTPFVIPNPLDVGPARNLASLGSSASAKSRPTRSSEILTHVSARQSDDSCLDGRPEFLREATDPLKALHRLSSTNCAPDVPAMIAHGPISRGTRSRHALECSRRAHTAGRGFCRQRSTSSCTCAVPAQMTLSAPPQ